MTERRVAVAVLLAAAFMAQLDLYVVNLAIPELEHAFHSHELGLLTWVLNGYALLFAGLLVVSGRIADEMGRRRVLLAGVAVFVIASAACAAAPGVGVLVAARCAQGIGAALMVPVSLGLLLEIFPPQRHAMVVGTWAAMNGIAASAGPVAGGLLIEASWRWAFLVNLPIGLIVLIAGLRVLPWSERRPGTPFPDPVGAVALLASAALLVLAIVQAPVWGWLTPRWDAVVVLCLLFTALLAWRCSRHPAPIVEAGLFRVGPFAAANTALVAFYVAFAAMVLASFLLLEQRWHYSTVGAALAFAPGPLASALCAFASGRLTARFGTRALAICGPVALAAAPAWWLLTISTRPDYAFAYLPGVLLAGVGGGLTQAPLFASVSALPAERAATGSAILSMTRQISSALGVALLAAIVSRPSVDGINRFDVAWGAMALCAMVAAIIAAAGLSGSPSAYAVDRPLGASVAERLRSR